MYRHSSFRAVYLLSGFRAVYRHSGFRAVYLLSGFRSMYRHSSFRAVYLLSGFRSMYRHSSFRAVYRHFGASRNPETRSLDPGFRPCSSTQVSCVSDPEGQDENSPAFQGWE
jgi:hypothetical protein